MNAPASSVSAVEAALHDHVRSAAMPCPYARLPTTYLHLDERDTAAVGPTLARALYEFYADAAVSILCVVPQAQPDTPRAARRQAYGLRLRLHQLHLAATTTPTPADEARLRVQYETWSEDSDSFLGPRMLVGAMDVMTTSFNPAYPSEHPRHAPYACMVVIRTADLKAIHDKRPDMARTIAVHGKCKLLLSMLVDAAGIDLDAMRGEYPQWVRRLGFYHDFVTTHYTAGYRIDPRTLPRLHEVRRRCVEAMESDRFAASLAAFRAMAHADPNVPTLARILAQNPTLTVFDVAKVVFGDVSGMYVPHS